jgi:hypothetical protein
MIIKINKNKTLLLNPKGVHFCFNIGWKDIDREIAFGMKISEEKARKIRKGEIMLSDPRKLHLFNEIFKYRLSDLFNLCTLKLTIR